MTDKLFLSVDLPDYTQNISTIVWAMFIGVIIAALLSVFYREVLGSFVRHLLKSGADSAENALKLADTKYAKNPFILSALRGGNIYRRVLLFEETYEKFYDKKGVETPVEKLRLTDDIVKSRRYYIPDDLKFRAENMFCKRGTNWFTMVMTILLFFGVALFCLLAIPDLIQMLNNFIASL